MTTLFDPIQMGELSLPNRIVMAPLTRCRASEGGYRMQLMAEYYVACSLVSLSVKRLRLPDGRWLS